MKTIAPVLFLFLLSAAVSKADDTSDLTRYRASYTSMLEKFTKLITDTYLQDLEKLRDQHIQSGRLDAAKAVQAEIDVVRRPELFARDETVPATHSRTSLSKTFLPGANPAPPRWFVGKSWVTDGPFKWNFAHDGISGDRVKAGMKVGSFTWRAEETGLLELTERTPTDKLIAITYIRFMDRSEAWAGFSPDKLDIRLRPE